MARHAVTICRGDSYPISFPLHDPSGDPVNLDGATVLLTVSTVEYPQDETCQVLQLTGSIVGQPTDGIVVFFPSPDDTGEVGTFYYDIQVVTASGYVHTPIKSIWTVRQDITKSPSIVQAADASGGLLVDGDGNLLYLRT